MKQLNNKSIAINTDLLTDCHIGHVTDKCIIKRNHENTKFSQKPHKTAGDRRTLHAYDDDLATSSVDD